jgi:hypothetical protein
MSDYLGYLANCVLDGIEFTNEIRDGKTCRVRNLIRLMVGGFELELHQDTGLSPNHSIVGQCVDTTKLFVRNVAQSDLTHLQEVIGHVCELLSFATESRVLPYAHEYPAGSVHGIRTAMVGRVQIWRPPFANPEHAKNFVELCFDNFVALRDRRKLHVVIDYIHHSIMKGLAREVQISLTCIAFENLRHNWARDTGYQYINGFFREKTATASDPGPRVGIERHLTEMFDEVGMTSDPRRIVETRNEVIHTGLFGNVHNDQTYEFMETTLREYFLRIVGYRGEFLPYLGGSSTPRMI